MVFFYCKEADTVKLKRIFFKTWAQSYNSKSGSSQISFTHRFIKANDLLFITDY